MLEENALDTTFTEDFLLTYRAFSNEPLRICKRLLEWFDQEIFRAKVGSTSSYYSTFFSEACDKFSTQNSTANTQFHFTC